MRKISTGEPSDLRTYRNIAFIMSGFAETEAVRFFDQKIEEYGENAEVIQDETQMLKLIYHMIQKDGSGS